MTINSVSGNYYTTPTTNVSSVGSTSSTGVGSVDGNPAATATISAPGQLFSELQQLSQQDPTTFKSVTAQLATNFQNAASQASGPQAQLLTRLADQFSQASQTGSLTPTQSTQQGSTGVSGGHGHHHHHGGGGGGNAALAFASTSPNVDQAYQSALSVVTQATSAGSSSTT